MVNDISLEAVSTDDIPERTFGNNRQGTGRYFAILTNFVGSEQDAALVRFDGDVKASTASSYLRKLIGQHNMNVSVLNRQGQVYLVRNWG